MFSQKTTTEDFLTENSIENTSLLKSFDEIIENVNAEELKEKSLENK